MGFIADACAGRWSRAALVSLVLFLSWSCEQAQVADVILVNGRIYTAESDLGIVDALAIQGERVLAVGSAEQVGRHQGDGTEIVDLAGSFVMPGFNDAHGHLGNAAMQALNLDLSGTASLADLQDKLARHIQGRPAGSWIYGRGWDESLWPNPLIPTRDDLDAVAPDHAVLLERADGHSSVANSLAMKRAGIVADTVDPQGGVIVRDQAGRATGWLKEKAVNSVERLIPEPSAAEWQRGLDIAFRDALENGVTTIQDDTLRMGQRGVEVIEVLLRMHRNGEMPVRVTAWLPFEDPLPALEKWRERLGNADPWLKAGLLKTNIDGSGGSLSAAMLAPYSTDPGNSGLLLITPDRLNEMVAERDAAGFQIGIHTIGDRANRLILDAYEQAIETNGPRDARHRIEHAQFVHDDDIDRFEKLDVIASMQPCHLLTDMRWAPDILGPDREHEGYRWNSLLNSGAIVAFGTDFPVEPIDPMRGLYAAVSREFEEGGPSGGWIPGEAITIDQAIRAYTADSAYAEFEDHRKGKLVAGQLADLVVLSTDLTTVDHSRILETDVVMTMVGGVIRFRRDE